PPEAGPQRPPPPRGGGPGGVFSAPRAVNTHRASLGKMGELETYKRKRDARKTPEPVGGRPGGGRAGAFLAPPPPAPPAPPHPPPRRAAAPLRLPPRARRRPRLLGGAEGHATRAGRPCSRRPRRGPPARVRDLRR